MKYVQSKRKPTSKKKEEEEEEYKKKKKRMGQSNPDCTKLFLL